MSYRAHLIRYRNTKQLKSRNYKGKCSENDTQTTWIGLGTSPTHFFNHANGNFTEVKEKTFWNGRLHPEALLIAETIEEAEYIKNAIQKDSKEAYIIGLTLPNAEIVRYDAIWCWEPI